MANMLKVINYTAGILGANNYLLFDDVSGECALVDCSDVVSIEDIFNQNLSDCELSAPLKLKYILLSSINDTNITYCLNKYLIFIASFIMLYKDTL